MTFIRFKIQSVEYFDCYLKVQQHFHLEKTDNVRPRKKIPIAKLSTSINTFKKILSKNSFLSTELSSTALSWMLPTQGTWTGNKQKNGKMKNENRSKTGWWVLIGLGLTSAFLPIFRFLGMPRPQSPVPFPRFSNLLLRLSLVTAYLKVRRAFFTLTNGATGKASSIAPLTLPSWVSISLIGENKQPQRPR